MNVIYVHMHICIYVSAHNPFYRYMSMQRSAASRFAMSLPLTRSRNP